MKHILVIGSINTDLVITTPKMPVSGETILGSGFHSNLGGKGANQAVACAKLGGEVRMLGCIGRDENGRNALRELERYGVDTEFVSYADAPSGAAVIVVCGGDNRIIVDKGANDCLTELPERALAWADVVIMQLEIPIKTVLAAAKAAKKLGKTVVLNPAPMAPLPDELFPCLDWIMPNETEALMLSGCREGTPWEDVISVIREKGCRNVLITLGEDGCIRSEGEGFVRCPAVPVSAVDTTAAGDTFLGAFWTAVCEGADLDRAAKFAANAAAITVTRRGAAESVPTRAELPEL